MKESNDPRSAVKVTHICSNLASMFAAVFSNETSRPAGRSCASENIGAALLTFTPQPMFRMSVRTDGLTNELHTDDDVNLAPGEARVHQDPTDLLALAVHHGIDVVWPLEPHSCALWTKDVVVAARLDDRESE